MSYTQSPFCCYVSSISKNSAVISDPVKLHFTSSTDTNLILNFSSYLEILLINDYGFKKLKHVKIYDSIISIFPIYLTNTTQVKHNTTDLLFVLTTFKFIILKYDSDEVITVVTGKLFNNSIDHLYYKILMHNSFLIIAVNNSLTLLKFNPDYNPNTNTPLIIDTSNVIIDTPTVKNITTINELNFVDNNFNISTSFYLSVLSENNSSHTLQLFIYQVSSSSLSATLHKTIGDFPLNITLLIQISGFIMLLSNSILYCYTIITGNLQKIPISSHNNSENIFQCYNIVDNNRILVGGSLGIISLIYINSKNSDILFMKLGSVPTIPHSLLYLDNQIVFIGSRTSNSLIAKIHNTHETDLVEVIETYTNHGPIIDMIVVNNNKSAYKSDSKSDNNININDEAALSNFESNNNTLITLSNVYKTSSLKVINNNVKFHVEVSMENNSILDIFILFSTDCYFTIISYLNSTNLFKFDVKENSLVEFPVKNLLDDDTYNQTEHPDSNFVIDRNTLFACSLLCHEGGNIPTPFSQTKISQDLVLTTYPCNNKNSNIVFIQVVENVIYRYSSSFQLLSKIASSCVISHFSNNLDSFLVSNSSNIYLFSSSFQLIEFISLNSINEHVQHNQILSSYHTEISQLHLSRYNDLIIISNWNSDIFIFDTSFTFLHFFPNVSSHPIRSLLLIKFDSKAYFLLAGTSNGYLLSWNVHENRSKFNFVDFYSLRICNDVLILSPYFYISSESQKTYVLAQSNQPALVYLYNNRLLFNYIDITNMRNIVYISKPLPRCHPSLLYSDPILEENKSEPIKPYLIFVDRSHMIIGCIDNICKLYIQTYPIDYSEFMSKKFPFSSVDNKVVDHNSIILRRISYSYYSDTFIIVSINSNHLLSYLGLYSMSLYNLLDLFVLKQELVSSICNNTSSNTSLRFIEYFIGTTITDKEGKNDEESGKLYLVSVNSGTINIHNSLTLNGVPWCLVFFKDKYILAGVNSTIQLFLLEQIEDKYSLRLLTTHKGHILTLCIRIVGEYILVGDLMKSISLFIYREEDNHIEEVARDFNSNWMLSMSYVNDHIFIGSESRKNLFTLVYNKEASNDEEKAHLVVAGKYHFGDNINIIRSGSVVNTINEDIYSNSPHSYLLNLRTTHLFGTLSGSIGCIIPLTKQQHDFLSHLQSLMEKYIHPIGELLHSEYRAYNAEHREPYFNYIDGELIESFIELPNSVQKCISDEMQVDSDELIKIVDYLSRIH